MSRNRYPTLLNKKATMIGSLTRYDLVILGINYLFLSSLKISGIYSLIINAFLLLLLKVIKKRFQFGFFRHLFSESVIESSSIQKHFKGGRYE